MSRRIATALAVAAAAFLVAGCGGTVDARPGAAEILPASATAYVALNTDVDSSQWRTLDALSKRFPDRGTALQAFDNALKGEGVSWERDVKPALGREVDFAWLDFGHGGQDFVVLIQPDDDKKFEQLISKDSSASAFTHERVGDFQVLAPRQELIDRVRNAGDTLSSRKPFEQAMRAYPDDFLVRAYVDGGVLMRLARRDPDPDVKKILPKLGTLDWLATNLGATPDGIRWDTNVHGTPGPAFKGISPTRPFAATLTQRVPKDAIAYFSFHGAKGMLTGLKKNPLLHDVPELRRYSGVLSQVESLLEGENALWVRPAGSGKLPEVTFVSEPGARTDGAATLDRLLARYRKQLELKAPPARVRVAGVPARLVANDPVSLYYADVGKRLVVTTRPSGIRALKAGGASLAQSADFRDAIDAAGMPARTQGFLYVSFKGGLAYAQRLAKVPVPDAVKRDLKPLRSAVEYGATRPSEVQVTFFLRIG